MLRKHFVYILRLLAGKSGRICTEFPLATFSAKNFINASFNISCHELFKQHLVQKKSWVNANYCLALSWKIIFVLRNSESTKSISSPEFFVYNSLHEMHAKKVFNEKTPWQAKDSSETWSVIDSFFSFCFKFWLVIRPMACHDVFSE